MERIHALATELGATARLGVEVVLSFASHQDLSILRHLESFEICFDAFHNTIRNYEFYEYTNCYESLSLYLTYRYFVWVINSHNSFRGDMVGVKVN